MHFKPMKKGYHHTIWPLLLAGLSCSSHPSRMAALFSDSANGLLQVSSNNQRSIVMEVLPANTAVQKDDNSGSVFLRVKLALRSDAKISGRAAMQYMNFGIQNSFYAVQGADTLPCLFCERIPGISEKEFVYILFFKHPLMPDEKAPGLRLVVTDTVAGFGISAFNIKNDALKKLEALK
jgi:hypothetical protein